MFSKRSHLPRATKTSVHAKVIEKFDEHFIPKKNIIHRRVQREGETVEAFIRNLYELVEHCDFGTQRDEQIGDRIVSGILDKSLSQKLQMTRYCDTYGASVRAGKISSCRPVRYQASGRNASKERKTPCSENTSS